MNIEIKYDDITENKLKSEELKMAAVHFPFLGEGFYNKEFISIRAQDAQKQLLDMIIDYPVYLTGGFFYALVEKDKLEYVNLINDAKSQVREIHKEISDFLEDGKINFSEYEMEIFLEKINNLITQAGVLYRAKKTKGDYKRAYEVLLDLVRELYQFTTNRKYNKREVY
jgi:hypothetical protein